MDVQEFVSLRKTVTTPFGEIAYIEKGSGPPALFVHGVLLNGYVWRHTIDALAEELDVSLDQVRLEHAHPRSDSGRHRDLEPDFGNRRSR